MITYLNLNSSKYLTSLVLPQNSELISKHHTSNNQYIIKVSLSHLLGLEWIVNLLFAPTPDPITGYATFVGG
jgi:hypothetical protein